MTTQNEEEIKRTLRGDFRGIVVKRMGDNITFDISEAGHINRAVIRGKDGQVVKLVPGKAKKANNEDAETIISTVDNNALDPANAVVKSSDVVKLNQLSRYLTDLPDEARAIPLYAPMDTALIRYASKTPEKKKIVKDLLQSGGGEQSNLRLQEIVRKNIRYFIDNIDAIGKIGEEQRFHHNGQIIKGINLSQYPYKDRNGNENYEARWAMDTRVEWQTARQKDQIVTTGFSMGTEPLFRDLFKNVAEINKSLKAQGGQEVITTLDDGVGRHLWHFIINECSECPKAVVSLNIHDGKKTWGEDDAYETASTVRPVALQIIPQ